MDGIELPALIAEVRRRVAGSPLDEIEAALAVSDELQAGADDLVGHFVTQARHAGCSWTEIGQRLGVSKQAARQRFTGPVAGPGELPELPELPERPRLQACREAARREASADGAAEVGTHHLLVGLFEEGAAAAIMEQIGLRRDAVRRAAHEVFPPSGDPGGGAQAAPGARSGAAPGAGPGAGPPESAEAREALNGAVRLARRGGCGYVGTEHLLGALALDPGSRARRVLIRLDASIPAIKRELECYISPPRRRRRRSRPIP